MRRPETLWQQYEGKAYAELMRGGGVWPRQIRPCSLEPPLEPFDRHSLNVWDCVSNGWEAPWENGLIRRMLNNVPVHGLDDPLTLPELPCNNYDDLVPIVIEQFPEDFTTIPKAEQFLLSFPIIRRPVSFEILGVGPQPIFDYEKFAELRKKPSPRNFDDAISGWSDPFTRSQFVCHRGDALLLRNQLIAQYPNSAVVVGKRLTSDDTLPDRVQHEGSYGGSLAFHHFYCQPLRTYGKLDPDPLGVAIAAMDHLDKDQWALLQVLFQPVAQSWAETLTKAVSDPYKPGKFLFNDVSERMLASKFSSPLFAVGVNLVSKTHHVFRQLVGWAEQFASPPQGFFVNQSEWIDGAISSNERDSLSWSVLARCTYRPGMILNAQELASLVHLPSSSIVSERLCSVKTRTRPATASTAEPGSVVLGDNVHRGERKVARIPAGLRARHCYMAGATGTGKSTLLLNMILQDITAGQGVGVLDPHGDLIKAVLQRIPSERAKDVILFDPADEEFPFALNILETKESERERVVAETLMALMQYFPGNWGQRIQRILTNAIHTVLEAIPGATLADVERILADEQFRNDIVANKLRSPRQRVFWTQHYKYMGKNVAEPVFNRLSVFLEHRVVRNIICQRHSAIDFDDLLSHRKILLANLSTGLLTEMCSSTLGSFIVSKILNAALRRAKLPQERRTPWYLYVDEFQSFMNSSVGFERILSEARKYGLVLAGLANQYVGQLSPAVRQAVFGTAGVMIAFRLGVDDANLAAKEFRHFTADEILDLEVGQALVRAGTSRTAYNIETYREPAAPANSSQQAIIDHSRQHFARPRDEVERELHAFGEQSLTSAASRPDFDDDVDPDEDDLVR